MQDSDHEALKYLNSQRKLNKRHAKWSTFLQEYTFNLRHKAEVTNQVADALSRHSSLHLTVMQTVVSFDSLKDQYTSDPYFSPIWGILFPVRYQFFDNLYDRGWFPISWYPSLYS